MPLPDSYRYAECRLLGHAWHTVPSDWTPNFGVPMTTRCERCDIERRDSVDRRTGDVLSRRYTYPDGYLFSRDPDDLSWEAPRRTDFRVAWLEDALGEQRERRQAKRKAKRRARK